MSRLRNTGVPDSDRDPPTPRPRKPEPPADPATAPDGDAPGASTNDHRKGSRDADYEVGYGRPPRQHRFKSGQSGNPHGRPKGVRSEADILNALLNKKIAIQERGRTRHISVLEAIYHRIAQNGLKGGDTKSATFLLNRMAAVAQRGGDQSTEMNEDDRAVLESFVAQVMNSHKNGGSK